jgi:hypothetical protein
MDVLDSAASTCAVRNRLHPVYFSQFVCVTVAQNIILYGGSNNLKGKLEIVSDRREPNKDANTHRRRILTSSMVRLPCPLQQVLYEDHAQSFTTEDS